jgi:deoxyhypusine synthase
VHELFGPSVTPFPVGNKLGAAELVRRMGGTAFQSRKLAQAVRIWDAMLQGEVTIFLGLAGAMVPGGMRSVLAYLIENRLVDCLVSTGANLYHDLYECLGYRHWQTGQETNDVDLAKQQVYRFYDVLASEEDFSEGERFITDFSLTLDPARSYTTREYFDLLGRALVPVAKEEGILTAAVRQGVPIYCPALADSVFGLAIAEGRLRSGSRLTFDVIADVVEMAHIATQAETSGVVYIGGGTPKNFIQQAAVAAYLFGREGSGHAYGIQITMDEPDWGGLSGCTFEEAQSWRKMAPDATFVTLRAEATIALPIIVSALAEGSAQAIRDRRRPVISLAGVTGA